MSDRFWILDPAGHRQRWAEQLPEDGETIDSPWGPSVAIVPPVPDPDDWVCDLCNTPLLTRWGDEPFPVPLEGGYALCHDHYDQTRGGFLWPAQLCACSACRLQADRWRPELANAYRRSAKEVIASN